MCLRVSSNEFGVKRGGGGGRKCTCVCIRDENENSWAIVSLKGRIETARLLATTAKENGQDINSGGKGII